MQPQLSTRMLETYRSIADEIIELHNERKRLNSTGIYQTFIAFAGPPGSGKSTTTQELMKLIPKSVVVPMDGYHYTKAELLDSTIFPNHQEYFSNGVSTMMSRRGAEFTFNANQFIKDLLCLKETGTFSFPSFDHGVGDPISNDINIDINNNHEVILIEGNYLLLDMLPWNRIVDEKIVEFSYFIDCELEVIEDRLIKRHMAANNNTKEFATERVHKNDLINAKLILEYKHRANRIIQSI